MNGTSASHADPSAEDLRFMRMALALARKGRGRTSPNPMVGAVLVRDGEVLGAGHHRAAGQPHAEVEALRDAARRGFDPKDATLYVTLEPCCTHGRTPPCTDAIVSAGIRRVVVGATDPNPHHAGRAYDLLGEAGIDVIHGVEERACKSLNDLFNHWIVHRTPSFTLKLALTLDGRIGDRQGFSQWITQPASRSLVQQMRRDHDALLVGVGTVVADNPGLNLRDRRGKVIGCKLRVVLDSQARIPLDSRILTDAGPTWVITGTSAPADRVDALVTRAEVTRLPERGGRIDVSLLPSLLASRGITSVLVEGGGQVAASLLAARLIHRTAFFYGSLVVGGQTSPRAVGGSGWSSLQDAPRLEGTRTRRIGPDLLVTGRVLYPEIPDPVGRR